MPVFLWALSSVLAGRDASQRGHGTLGSWLSLGTVPAMSPRRHSLGWALILMLEAGSAKGDAVPPQLCGPTHHVLQGWVRDV